MGRYKVRAGAAPFPQVIDTRRGDVFTDAFFVSHARRIARLLNADEKRKLMKRIVRLLKRHPGLDQLDVSEKMSLRLQEACELLDEMAREGTIKAGTFRKAKARRRK